MQNYLTSESGHRNLVSLMFCYLIDHDQKIMYIVACTGQSIASEPRGQSQRVAFRVFMGTLTNMLRYGHDVDRLDKLEPLALLT